MGQRGFDNANVNSKRSHEYTHAFLKVKEVQYLLQFIKDRGTFSLHTIKRGISAYLKARISPASPVQSEMPKPDGLSVTDMFDPALFQPGSFALLPASYSLRPQQMGTYHCTHCSLCKPLGHVSPHCYFYTMLRCVTHGWHPPCAYADIRPQYRTYGNYPSVARFRASADKEMADMIANKVLIPCRAPKIVNPIGAILKNSDIMRAKVLAGVSIVDQESLSRASALLVAAGHPKVKCRLTTDLTATGVNRASYVPPFRYPSLGDALRIIKRNGFIASGDVSRYFHSFPLAIDARPYWGVEYGGRFLSYAMCCFGHGACPYYSSTWSAEFRQWALAAGIDPAFMVDDWVLCALTLPEARRQLQCFCSMLEACGFSMSAEKFQYGQKIVFIGVLIDTSTMTMRFDATQARGMRMQLEMYLERILRGSHLDHSTIRHVCGKLNWYSEIVQSGRLHIKSWWDYERHGKSAYPGTILKLVQDTQWWIGLQRTWENERSGQVEYQILSADEIQNNPHSIVIIQSDASGTDGFGYYSGYLEEEDLAYTSKQWNPALEPDTTSHSFELRVLEYYLLNDCRARDAILVWISDNEGATWSVNKGRSREPEAMRILSNILEACDEKRLQLVALWVPRERNELADYLSHLAVYVNRDTVKGHLSDLF